MTYLFMSEVMVVIKVGHTVIILRCFIAFTQSAYLTFATIILSEHIFVMARSEVCRKNNGQLRDSILRGTFGLLIPHTTDCITLLQSN